MASELELKNECAKTQTQLKAAEETLQTLQRRKEGLPYQTNLQKENAIADERAVFDAKNRQDIRAITTAVEGLRGEVEALVNSFPEAQHKEFAGKYEVKSIEKKLEETYPPEMVQGYTCISPIEFDNDREAYRTYTALERNSAVIQQGSVSSALFNSLTRTMEKAAEVNNMGSKVAFIVLGIAGLSFIVSPFICLALYSVIAITSALQGVFVRRLLRSLCSIKLYLNDAYDEDIFQEDKNDIMEEVDTFLGEATKDYVGRVESREFKEPVGLLRQIDLNAESTAKDLESQIAAKQQECNQVRARLAKLIADLDLAIEERKNAAQNAVTKFLKNIDWKKEWFTTIFTGVSSEDKILGCQWNKCNTIYLCEDLSKLQNFAQLAVYQNLIHMHPHYAKQVVIDHKYLGGGFLPLSNIGKLALEILIDTERITERMDNLVTDIRSRSNKILVSSPDFDSFNKMMEENGADGESYVIVHIFGLSSITPGLKLALKNGGRVGYMFKIYATHQELQNLAKDVPFEDVQEYVSVGDIPQPRTLAQTKRILGIDAEK